MLRSERPTTKEIKSKVRWGAEAGGPVDGEATKSRLERGLGLEKKKGGRGDREVG